jgi:hypothetical protein
VSFEPLLAEALKIGGEPDEVVLTGTGNRDVRVVGGLAAGCSRAISVKVAST